MGHEACSEAMKHKQCMRQDHVMEAMRHKLVMDAISQDHVAEVTAPQHLVCRVVQSLHFNHMQMVSLKCSYADVCI